MVVKTNDEFIDELISIHSNKFQYDKILYKNSRSRVLIGYKGDYVEHIPYKCLDPNFRPDSTKFKTDEFIDKLSKILDPNLYDFSRVEYNTNVIPVEIGFNGVYYKMTPSNLLKGTKPGNQQREIDSDKIRIEANIIHNYKYQYDFTNLKFIKSKIGIICPSHGLFAQFLSDHLNGHGCPKCGKESMSKRTRINFKTIIERIELKHGNKYTYKNLYDNNNLNLKTILDINCPYHGGFKQKTVGHLKFGCKKCGKEISNQKQSRNKDEFIKKANEKWDEFYNYDKFIYILSSTKSIIICPIHGEFQQTPNIHLRSGCKKCGYEKLSNKMKMEYNKFFNICNEKHNFKYDYCESIYVNSRTKIKIKCPVHGYFNQNSQAHFSGSGCPSCNESRGELAIRNFLESKPVDYIREKQFDNCLKTLPLPFDFYLPKYNLCIEFDGIQHFKPLIFFGGENALEYRKNNDEIKNQYCMNNNINLLRISYKEIKNVENILKKELKIND